MRRVMARCLSAYISIALVVIILLMPIFITSYRSAREQKAADMQQVMEGNMDMLISSVRSIHLMADSLKKDPYYVRLCTWSDNEDKTNDYLYIAFRKTLMSLLYTNDFVTDVFVMFGDGETVTTKSMSAGSRRAFYTEGQFRFEEMSMGDWMRTLWNTDDAIVGPMLASYQNQPMEAALFLFRSTVMGESRGVISVLIDLERLTDMMLINEIREYGTLRLSVNEHILFEYTADNYRAGMTFSLDNSEYGLRMDVGFSADLFRESSRSVLKMLFTYISLTLIIALSLSLLYTLNVYRPVRNYYLQMKEDGFLPADEQTYSGLLEVSIGSLLTTKQDLERSLKTIEQKHRDNLIGSLLSGLPVSDMEVQNCLGEDPLVEGGYVVVRLCMKPTEDGQELPMSEVEKAYAMTAAALRERFDSICLPDWGTSRFCAVLGVNENDIEECCLLLERIAVHISGQCGCLMSLAISRAYRGTEHLRDAYVETTQLFRFASRISRPVMRSDQMGHIMPGPAMVFQPDILIGQLEMTDNRALSSYVGGLMERLETLHYERPGRAEQLYDNITDACMAARGKYNLNTTEYAPYSSEADIAEIVASLRTLIADTQAQIQECRKEGGKKPEAVLDYIRDHFNDPELSLSMLASLFYYSEGYIYQLVRKHTGLSYVDFLTGLRMDRALELVRNSQLSTAEIAEQCGFSNLNTFYKAFKKKYGVPPRHFRDEGTIQATERDET